MRRATLTTLGWLLCGLGALSCSGKPFTSGEASGGATADGSNALGGAGSGFVASAAGASIAGGGTSAVSDAGTSAVSDAGTSAVSDAGTSAVSDAGAGNSPDGLDCAVFHGEEFGGHCYVDATVESNSAQQAVAACLQLASEHQVLGHLLVLDSAEEQGFVLNRLLLPFTDVSDAWLGLTCNQLDRPDINDCYCSGCSKALLAEKQATWAWLGGASSTFGWINGNPNGGYRCAALAYNPELTIWGWVDRPCDKISFSPSAGHTHGYRTVCELEG
jgi:hypothetical protein